MANKDVEELLDLADSWKRGVRSGGRSTGKLIDQLAAALREAREDMRMLDWRVCSDEDIARFFHEEYELLAPLYGYTTRPESRTPWPPPNRDLMVATVMGVRQRVADAAMKPPGGEDGA